MPLWLVNEAGLPAFLAQLSGAQAAWLKNQGFQAERARVVAIPDERGAVAAAVAGLGSASSLAALNLWDAASLPERLPAGRYRLGAPLPGDVATQFALGWLLGSYRYARFRSQPKAAAAASLVLPDGADGVYAEAAAAAMCGARDLINAPANELGPEQLAQAAADLAQEFAGRSQLCRGDELRQQYPLVHAVGAGSARPPQLIDCRWPRANAPKVTLVGKGVCFDSGGLDLKPSAGMLLMKKDMGGAACALGLARLLLTMRAPVQLRLLIPAVENSVGGNCIQAR